MKDRKILMAMVASAGMVFMPFLRDPYLFPKSICLAVVCLAVLLLKRDRTSSLEVNVLCGLAVVIFLSMVSKDFYYSAMGSTNHPFDSVIDWALLGMVLASAARLNVTLLNVSQCLTIASVPVSVYAITQKFISDPMLPGPLPSGRVISTMGSPVYLGVFLALCLVAAVYAFQNKDRRAKWAIPLIIAAMLFSKTRGALLAAFVGLLFLDWRSALWMSLPGIVFAPRLVSMKSDLGRIETWRIAWDAFKDNPVYGYGPGCFSLAFRRYITDGFVAVHGNAYIAQEHSHNAVLQVLAVGGIVGLLAYFFLVKSVADVAWWHKDEKERRLLFGVLSCYAVFAMLNPIPVGVTAVLVIFLGVASSIQTVPYRQWAYCLAGIPMVYILGCFVAADFYSMRAIRERKDPYMVAAHSNDAAVVNPWDSYYTMKQVRSLAHLAMNSPKENRKALMEAGINISGMNLRRHRNDSFANQVFAESLVLGIMEGAPVSPESVNLYFNRAQELAPTFEPILRRQVEIARAFGDVAKLSEAEKNLQRLHEVLRSRATKRG